VKRRGRPYSNKKTLDEITSTNMDIIMRMFRAKGIKEPTEDQIVELWETHKQAGQRIGRDPRKGAELARQKIREINQDGSLQRLDVETKKLKRPPKEE